MTGSARAARALARPALALLLGCLSASATAQSANPYLDAAIGLAAWMDEATAGGTRWPRGIDNDGVSLQPGSGIGLDGGAAGPGLFLAQLHAHTGDERHLALARAAAAHERSFHLRGVYNGFDYLSGAAGSGLVFLALHAQTGDARYVQWARDLADWLEQTANRPAPDQAWWWHGPNFPRHYTGIPHGATGVALFQLALYHRTGDPAYLADAEDAYRWVRTHALPVGTDGAIGFKRLVADTDIYNWWSGGSAGVLLLQGQLYASTGSDAYLDDLRRTADGLLLLADAAPSGGVRWTTGSDGSSYRPIVFSHGNGSIAPALLVAHQYTGDPRYLSGARASVAWLASMAQDGTSIGADGFFWQHNPSWDFVPHGAFTGTGSVGWALARMSPMLVDPAIDALAVGSADYLLARVEQPAPGQLRWINYPGPEDTDWATQGYPLGWYDGNAGIGLFLLAIHELTTGLRPGIEVHAP